MYKNSLFGPKHYSPRAVGYCFVSRNTKCDEKISNNATSPMISLSFSLPHTSSTRSSIPGLSSKRYKKVWKIRIHNFGKFDSLRISYDTFMPHDEVEWGHHDLSEGIGRLEFFESFRSHLLSWSENKYPTAHCFRKFVPQALQNIFWHLNIEFFALRTLPCNCVQKCTKTLFLN